jgi:glycosyltransferase involved in cell wall biosynthesis
MEALASGLPVVATAVGGVPEQIRDGETGILVQPRSPRELADALAGMFSNPEARMRMGSAAADDARQRFDIRRTAAAYLEWFEGIVAC